MPARPTHPDIVLGTSRADAATRSDADRLRTFVIAAGICWSVFFVVIGLRYELQMYGDGAMFSYSVAVQDAWAFHWHNISGRLTVYLLSLLPAEAYIGLTGDPGGGIIVYGFLFFVAPLLGLIATYVADRSNGRIFSATHVSRPLASARWSSVSRPKCGWRTLYFGRRSPSLTTRVGPSAGLRCCSHCCSCSYLPMKAPLFWRPPSWPRCCCGTCGTSCICERAGALLVALSIWAAVKLIVPPGNYFAAVIIRAALDFFDFSIFTGDLVLLLFGTIASYGVVFLVLARLTPAKAPIYAASIVAVALAAYWILVDHGLHAADRYYLRTILVIVTPMLGVLAAVHALRADGQPILAIPGLARIMTALSSRAIARLIGGAFLLVMLVHAVETAKFVMAWTKYKAAVAALATGTASDPSLGDPHFVSSDRIGADRNRLSWFSTTPYLSVIVANFAPTRLVVDPRANNYFWLSCETATANLKADRAVPAESRRLVRVNACLHR